MDDRPPRKQPPPPGVPSRRPGPPGAPPRPPKNADPYDYESIFLEEDKPKPPIYKRVKKKDAKKYGIIAAAVVISLIVGVTIKHQFNPPGSPNAEVTIQIPQGATLSSVGKTLDSKNVIPSALAFRIAAKIDKDNGKFQAGEYAFLTNSSAGEALKTLHAGPKQSTDRLIIPEGLQLREIAQRVGRIPGMSETKFLQLAQGGTVQSELQPSTVKSLEGFLAPNTYPLAASDNEQTLLERMVNQFDTDARSLGLDKSGSQVAYSPYDALIIASLVEAEAKTPGDRGKIAQVISNRLTASMPLGIDAALMYDPNGPRKTSLSKSDLRAPGLYNVYLNKGLPPTPICSPGRASIEAVLAPTPGPWLYYVVADDKGNHAFATTLDEHNKNVAAAKAKGLL